MMCICLPLHVRGCCGFVVDGQSRPAEASDGQLWRNGNSLDISLNMFNVTHLEVGSTSFFCFPHEMHVQGERI
jgi:hypothetical protein